MSVPGRKPPVHGRPRGRHEAALQLERHEHFVEDDLRFQVFELVVIFKIDKNYERDSFSDLI